MPVYKDEKKNTWIVKFHYKDNDGKTVYVTKRGFPLKRDAEMWEDDYKKKLSGDTGISFCEFIDLYKKEHYPRLRKSTVAVKENMVDNLITPYFRNMKLNEIDSTDVIRWQNTLLSHDDGKKAYTKSYLATVHSVLSSIFNYAVKYYKLKENPAVTAGKIGSLKRTSDAFWTKEEYCRFRNTLTPGSQEFLAFELLYWAGIREGELLALTPDDIDFTHHIVTISKTLHFLKGEVIIDPPKTPDGHRRIKIPATLSTEIKNYIDEKQIPGESFIFTLTRAALRYCMDKAGKHTDLRRIRVHDLRHSNASLLIRSGYSPVAIGERLGHSSSYVTLRYAHMYPGTQKEIADKLNEAMESLIS